MIRMAWWLSFYTQDIVSGPSEDEQEGHESDDGNGAGPRDAGHDSDKEGSDFSELQVRFHRGAATNLLCLLVPCL